MHTGDLLAELLISSGVEVVFGVPGGQTCALFDGLASREPKIRHVVCRDERTVAFAADAYARLTNRLGVCDVTVGPGTVKLPSGLMEAHYSSIPILCLISEVQLGWNHLFERGAALQAMDQQGLIRQFCKWTTTVQRPQDLPVMYANAVRRACSGRPGPAALVIPHDVFDAQTSVECRVSSVENVLARFPLLRSAPDAQQVERAVRLLYEAKRPVMVCGGGVNLSQAQNEVRELAELLSMPVCTTHSGRGCIEDDHPLALGLLGNIGVRCAQQAAEAADTLFLVGFKSGQNSTFNWKLPRADQKVIHLDLDEAEIGKTVHTEVGLVGDARLGLRAMIEACGDRRSNRDSAGWVAYSRHAWEEEIQPQLTSDDIPIKPQRVMHELNQLTDPDDVVLCDASYVTGWGGMYYRVRKPQRTIMAPRGSAGLGFAIPASIGAALARPGARCLALCGDHGVSYAIGELATIRNYGLKVVVIVFNNQGSRWIDHWHRMYFRGDGAPFLWGDTDYAAVGRGFGCLGIRVERPEHLRNALKEALNDERPAVVDIIVSGEDTPLLAYQEALARQSPVSYQG